VDPTFVQLFSTDTMVAGKMLSYAGAYRVVIDDKRTSITIGAGMQ
jgi:hypothetical protein